MTFLGTPLKKTIYPQPGGKVQFLLTTPHDSSKYEPFWQQFPKIFKHSDILKEEELFSKYLAIEQDRGACQLAHQIARDLAAQLSHDESVMVLEFCSPRGIVDCGRLESHCLRGFLPSSLLALYRKDFLSWQQKAHFELFSEIEALKKNKGLLLDLHTMASYGPERTKSMNYLKDLPEESWQQLQTYVDVYSKRAKTLRAIDLISCDESEVLIADKKLAKTLSSELKKSYSVCENSPYEARSYFLMNLIMKKVRAVALDVPKHFVASEDLDKDFSLDTFTVSEKKIRKISKLITAGMLAAV